MDVLKISAKSNPNSVAGALAGVIRERRGRNAGYR
ncbi:MAG TPA: stage V sporulation protein S, partial [Clostridiales bacterium]|nr:stage V sporulation protein S [Clostridiales bacterium]